MAKVLISGYSEVNQGTDFFMAGQVSTNFSGIAQSVVGTGDSVDSLIVYMKKSGSPTGDAVSKIYAHSGSFGVSSVPTGAALATSSSLDVSSLTTSYQLIEFTFTGADAISLTKDTLYCVSVEYSNGVAGSHVVGVGTDTSSPSAGGNEAEYTANGGWVASAGEDMCFRLYSGTTPRNTTVYSKQGFQ